MSEVLRSGTQLIRNIRRNKNRKSLQVLQPSADDHNLLVPSPIMVNRSEKEATKSNITFTIPDENCLEKENSSVVRRSKRKNVFLEGQPETKPSKEDVAPTTSKNQKPKVSKAVSKSRKAAVTTKLEKKLPGANQSSLDSFVFITSKSDEPGESNNIDNSTSAVEDQTVRVFKSVSEETDLLTSDVPSETYFIEIAEQRRLALEKALYENAQLVDQIIVLETENGQLKSTLKEFEKVVEAINASL